MKLAYALNFSPKFKRFFRELKKYFLKCILKHKGPQVAKSFEQNKQFESLSDFKTLTTKPLQ